MVLPRLRHAASEALLRPLPEGRAERLEARAARLAQPASPLHRRGRAAQGERMAAAGHEVDEAPSRCRRQGKARLDGAEGESREDKIGRATCRERGCEEGWSSVGGGSKKNNKKN